MLRTITDESVISSFHMMKSLLMKVTEGAPLNKRSSRNIPRRAGTPGPGCESSSEGESTAVESDGYTSGAINSDEDFRNIDTSSGDYPSTISASRTLDTFGTAMDASRVLTPNSGSSFSSGDYRPLASLTQAQSPVTDHQSSPQTKKIA